LVVEKSNFHGFHIDCRQSGNNQLADAFIIIQTIVNAIRPIACFNRIGMLTKNMLEGKKQ
jgi:hypothetical protein